MQLQRYEVKYVVALDIKESVRAFVASYLDLDDFAAAAEDYAYPIHSIYFDSPTLGTHQAAENGDRNRFKLRLRYYDDNPDSPAFLEVKRRADNVIFKTRCMVSRDAVTDVLAGDTSQVRPKDIEGHALFLRQMNALSATPKAHVAYVREAWVSRYDNSVRVTIDRQVRVEPKFDLEMTTAMQNPASPYPGQMILELKYTNHPPAWFRDIIHTFHLMQSGGPKYSSGLKLYGEQHFMEPVFPVV